MTILPQQPEVPATPLLDIQMQCQSDSERWFPDKAKDLPFMTIAMTGELGEFAELIKKIERGTVKWDDESRFAMAMELIDLFTYLCCAATILAIDLEKGYHAKRSENIVRFTKANTNGGVPNGGSTDVDPGGTAEPAGS